MAWYVLSCGIGTFSLVLTGQVLAALQAVHLTAVEVVCSGSSQETDRSFKPLRSLMTEIRIHAKIAATTSRTLPRIITERHELYRSENMPINKSPYTTRACHETLAYLIAALTCVLATPVELLRRSVKPLGTLSFGYQVPPFYRLFGCLKLLL